MTMNIKRKCFRVVVYLLTFSLFAGSVPLYPDRAQAITVEGSTFDPASQELEISFDLQFEQHVRIEAFANNEFFGCIYDDEVLSGYSATGLEMRLPEYGYDTVSAPGQPATKAARAAVADKTVLPEESEQRSQTTESTDSSLPEDEIVVTPSMDDASQGDGSERKVDQADESAPHEESETIGSDAAQNETATPAQKNDLETDKMQDEAAEGTASYADSMIQNLQVRVVDKTQENRSMPLSDIESPEAGHHVLTWDGRVNGYAVLGKDDRLSDLVEVKIVIHPMGDASRNSPCTDTENPDGSTTHNHGENWTWTQEYRAESAIFIIDYKLGIALQTNSSTSQKALKEMREIFQSGDRDAILALGDQPGVLIQEFCVEDPVNMVDGNYISSYTDLRLESGIPLSFMRFYNSRYAGGSLGKGFTHGYEYRLLEDKGIIKLTIPGGEELHFIRIRPQDGGGYHALQNSGFTLADDSGGYLLKHKDGAEFDFAADGNLASLRNPSGVTASMSYRGDQLTEIAATAGTLTLAWDGDVISSITDSAGRTVSYTYDGNLLTGVQNPDGDTLSFAYDSNGYVSECTDFNGDTYLYNTYDDLGRVTNQRFRVADQVRETSYGYDEDNRVNTFTSPEGRATKYYYDEHRNILKVEDPSDGTTENTYDNHHPDSLTDRFGNQLGYTYDARGNVTQATNADGTQTKYTYTADDQPKSVTYADGGVAQYRYDGVGNLISNTDQNGHETTYSYNALGLRLAETDALSNTTRYAYDANGRLTAAEDAEGGKVQYTYDGVGRVQTQKDPLGNQTTYAYSSAGKLLSVTDALGSVTAYEYNGNGFTTKTTDALGNSTTTEYGTNGQPLVQTDARGNQTAYHYSARTGLLESITDAEGGTVRYAYDDKGRVVETTDGDDVATQYEYDKLDRVVKTTDSEGNATTTEYDSMGRTAKTTDARGAETSYTYDAVGRTKTVTDAEGGVYL